MVTLCFTEVSNSCQSCQGIVKLLRNCKAIVKESDLNRLGDLIVKLFDFFIHPLDTALFLADDKLVREQVHYRLETGLLSQVMGTIMTKTSTVTASMDLQSGSRREVMEVQRAKDTYHLENLDDLSSMKVLIKYS
ncbi:hypothetical protein FMV2238Y02_05580 [Streptococcus canis]|uniref:YceM-like C-terminal domain-containing protein n=1 Tax=Streptococcus canis TaxID=1329 RepID=A0A3P5XMZ5_STRCB|nr:hypothetical protein FMV2238Y02_05580 [Streptococcus canis]